MKTKYLIFDTHGLDKWWGVWCNLYQPTLETTYIIFIKVWAFVCNSKWGALNHFNIEWKFYELLKT